MFCSDLYQIISVKIRLYRAQYCVCVIRTKYDTIYEYIKQTSNRLGYITNIYYLDTDNYGTGEKRERSIVLGIKKNCCRKFLAQMK